MGDDLVRSAVVAITLALLGRPALAADLDIKGISLGQSKSQVQAVIGGRLTCWTKDRDSDCLLMPESTPDKFHTLANETVDRWDFLFRDDALVKLTARITQNGAVAAMGEWTKKYGAPVQTSQPMINGLGIKIDRDVVAWQRGKDQLLVVTHTPTVDKALVLLTNEPLKKGAPDV